MIGQVLTAIVTPFDERGAVDYASFQRLCRYLVANGSDGLVVAGTTGEAPTLTDDERLALFASAREAVGDEVTVIAATGTYSTARSVQLTQEANALGVDGFLVVVPYYNKPPARGVVAHFAAVAQAADKPVIVYNIPARTGLDLAAKTLAELARIERVEYVKQAAPDLAKARQIVELGLGLLAGNDELLLPFLELGGQGGIFVSTHVVGPKVREIIARFHAGDHAQARALAAQLEPLLAALALETNPIPVKAALELLGLAPGRLRLPLVALAAPERARLAQALAGLGLL